MIISIIVAIIAAYFILAFLPEILSISFAVIAIIALAAFIMVLGGV